MSMQDARRPWPVCAKIKAKHTDILDRLPDELYRYMLVGPDERQALFDYLTCNRVAAWAAKKKARSAVKFD